MADEETGEGTAEQPSKHTAHGFRLLEDGEEWEDDFEPDWGAVDPVAEEAIMNPLINPWHPDARPAAPDAVPGEIMGEAWETRPLRVRYPELDAHLEEVRTDGGYVILRLFDINHEHALVYTHHTRFAELGLRCDQDTQAQAWRVSTPDVSWLVPSRQQAEEDISRIFGMLCQASTGRKAP